jgi:ubiquinone/menaquinone biosynthesis C-methylase UbiE
MIEELKKDIQRNQMSNVLCLNDDIYSRNFEAEFDYVISGFFLVSFLYREDQLRRVWRFLKEGGCLGFSSWGRQTDQIWLTKIVEKYIGTNEEDSVKLYNSRESIKEAVISSGFVNVEIIEETSIVQYSNKEHWWNEMQSNAFKNVIATIENKGIEVLKEFVEEVNEGLEAFNHEESYRFKMPVIYCKAKKVTSKLL